MDKIRKIISILLTAIIIISVSPGTVLADVLNMPDGGKFDPMYYATNNADVVAAYGIDILALYNHYLQYGKAEGRLPYDKKATKNSNKSTAVVSNVYSQEAVAAKIAALRNSYPDGTPWGENAAYACVNQRKWAPTISKACQGFAYMMQDQIFGPATIKRQETKLVETVVGYGKSYQCIVPDDNSCWQIVGYNGDNPIANANFEFLFSQIRPGDIVCDPIHAFLVTGKDANGIMTVSGNVSVNGGPGVVMWDRYVTKESLRRGFTDMESAY